MLGEISSGLSIVEFLTKWSKKFWPLKKQPPENIATRFFLLFESHGVHQNQIPSLIGHGLTIADVQTEEALFPRLNDAILNDVCELFAVRREWLDGADDQIYPLHDFYKWPEQFSEFLDGLLVDKAAYEVSGVVLATRHANRTGSALIILEEPVGLIGDKSVCRYHLCHNWVFSYWKSRTYLSACVAIAWKKKVCLMGRYVDQSVIDQYQDGRTLLEYSINTALPLNGAPWCPEEMALKPEIFLDGIDEDGFGKAAALNLWLAEEKKGLMDTGLGYLKVRDAFENKLGEMQSSHLN
ncbi:hypothetical protein [Thiomicrospira sp. WB1]|uniref:hypothetical protein n=1 Tax=Thiomicrospira sp. WB1 TaxID=1685380 RepID=UPI0007472B90|nr:hypothetical protein [Thiomicrospira sp. WB1]KUJ72512.1 hypothetical protein AVO41_01495 [Thiomicrospira sp. WB1]